MMQWMRRCCLHLALLAVTFGGGQSAKDAPVATAQLTRQAVLDVRPGSVSKRIDGLIIPWQRQPDLLTYSLHLGLCGISEREVRELGLWAYLQSYEVHNPLAREEAQTVVDTKLASTDMYQHLSYFGKVLPYPAFFNMLDLLRHRMHARKQGSRRSL